MRRPIWTGANVSVPKSRLMEAGFAAVDGALTSMLFGFAFSSGSYMVGRTFRPAMEGAMHAIPSRQSSALAFVSAVPAMRPRSAELLNLEETAFVLGIGRSTIYRAVRDGKVPFPVHRIGGKWYVPKRALQRFLDGKEAAHGAEGLETV
jgi:excisionase family DNA binding protein